MEPRLGKKFMDEPEDLADYRARRAEQEATRQRAEEYQDSIAWATEHVEANKDSIALWAFGDAFEDILREVARDRPTGTPGITGMTRFLDMLERGARVDPFDLAVAGLRRVYPDYGRLDIANPDRQALAIAQSALAFLIESRASDKLAPARRLRRRDDLDIRIQDYVEARAALRAAREAERAAEAKRTAPISVRKKRGRGRPPETQNTPSKTM
jgi:hypothetical protein